MPAVRCVGVLSVIVVVLLAGGCGEDKSSDAQTPASASDSSSTTVEPSPTSSTTPTPSATTTAAQLSTTVRLTGYVVTRDGIEKGAGALAAIGWSIDGRNGNSSWSDPAQGNISVIWDPPAPTETDTIESKYGGDVIGGNLAMGPVGWSSTTFTTTTPTETGAHSINGVRTDAPSQIATFTIPEMPPGTTATLSIGLGFPVPVSVTYNYVYQ